MKQNKLVIVVLVIIGVLFVRGLSSGVFRDKDDKDDELSLSKVEDLKSTWIGLLDKVMDPFRHGLDQQRLGQWAEGGQTGERFYTLSDDKEHDTLIAEKAGADVEKAVLSAVNDNVKINVKIMVPYPVDETCPEATTRGAPVLLSKFQRSKAITGIGKIKPVFPVKPGKVKPGASPQPLILSVIYIPDIPKSEKGKTKRCAVTGDVELTVLDKGGTLRLGCKGCNNNRTVTVKMK
jgi:hypothetical protein